MKARIAILIAGLTACSPLVDSAAPPLAPAAEDAPSYISPLQSILERLETAKAQRDSKLIAWDKWAARVREIIRLAFLPGEDENADLAVASAIFAEATVRLDMTPEYEARQWVDASIADLVTRAFARRSPKPITPTPNFTLSRSNPSAHYVSPHFRRNGTFVSGGYRTNPNSTQIDNFSARGNYNPYRGTFGTRSPRR